MEQFWHVALNRTKWAIKYMLDKTNADDVPEILDKMNNYIVEFAEVILKSCKKE